MANLEDVLKRLGWDDGFQIPISNAENKELERELARLSLRKSKAKTSLDRTSERLDGLKDHFKYVGQENEQNQKLITAHTQQLRALEHQYRVAKAEREGVEQEIKQTAKELRESEEREEKRKCDLERGMAKAEKLKRETDWDSEALSAWEEALRKRDDDNELMKKFSHEDERKYNELEARRQNLQADCDRGRGVVEKMVSELRNCEMIVERTGNRISLKRRCGCCSSATGDVVRAQEMISATHELVEKKKEQLQDANELLSTQQRINRDIENDIQNLNVLNSKMRRDLSELAKHVLLLNGELQCLRRDVVSNTQHLENERINGKRMDHDVAYKGATCAKYQEDINRLNAKVEEMKSSCESSEDKLKRIEKMIEAEERQYDIYMTDTEKLNMVLFLSDRSLKELIAIGKKMELDIANATCNCSHLRKHMMIQTKELNKLKEVVYDMEFRIDDYEQKLVKLEAERRQDANSEEKERRIRELEQSLADHKDVHHTLQNQVDRLEEEMHRLSNTMALDKEQQNILQDRCEQHLLVFEISKKHIAAAKRSTQEKQVEENMMRLRINQIEKDMKKEDKQIYSLEKLRLHLDQAMKERQMDIDMRKMVLHTKKRSLEEDKGRLRSDIGLRRLKIEQLQKKYHIVLMSLGRDEDGQPLSVTHIKIRNAQEKFMLQQEGDVLDQRIKTAEKEIVAMENALKLVNITNVAFKNSLAPVKDEGKAGRFGVSQGVVFGPLLCEINAIRSYQEVREMRELEEKLKETNLILKEFKKVLAAKQGELDETQDKFNEIDDKRSGVKEIIDRLEEEVQMVQKQASDKAEKLQRAECHLKRVSRRLSNTDLSKYDRDFEIRQMKEANRHVLQRLSQMALDYPEMAPLVGRYAAERNVSLPEKRSTPSLSSTSRSSFGSCASSRRKSVGQGGEATTARSDASHSSVLKKIDLSLQI
ncbi:hypothetical protein NQ318_019808 [Aromia moschata]|uniref:Coiled-coil domain-containing protein 39 n=1 Tax=Aromia moschata TaxID=1265417 RepID=A0AAV8YM61_9CUCU|nr:hypothetical protein NQ318_019808 [Aromia moschata]